MLNFVKVALAQKNGLVTCTTNCGWSEFKQLIYDVINFGLIYVAIPVTVLAILYGAILLLTSGGSEQKVESGKKAITAAIVGLLIVLSSWIIVNTIISFLTGKPFSGNINF